MFSAIQPFTNDRLKNLLYIASGVFLLALTAQISIPLKPIPITLQTVGVMLVALTFDKRSALAAVSTYLTLGALGAPLFANGHGGLPILLGPTGGYLIGFLAAVKVMTTLKTIFHSQSFFNIAFNCLIGTAIIFGFGMAWLAKFVGFKEAFQAGFLPFLLPGLVKVLLLTISVKYLNLRAKSL